MIWLVERRCGVSRWIGWRNILSCIGSNRHMLIGYILVTITQPISIMLV